MHANRFIFSTVLASVFLTLYGSSFFAIKLIKPTMLQRGDTVSETYKNIYYPLRYFCAVATSLRIPSGIYILEGKSGGCDSITITGDKSTFKVHIRNDDDQDFFKKVEFGTKIGIKFSSILDTDFDFSDYFWNDPVILNIDATPNNALKSTPCRAVSVLGAPHWLGAA